MAHEGSEELQESWECGSPHACLGPRGHLGETCKGPEPMTLLDLKAGPTEVRRKETSSAIWLSVEENHEATRPSSSHNSKWEKLKSDPTPRLSKRAKGQDRSENGRWKRLHQGLHYMSMNVSDHRPYLGGVGTGRESSPSRASAQLQAGSG